MATAKATREINKVVESFMRRWTGRLLDVGLLDVGLVDVGVWDIRLGRQCTNGQNNVGFQLMLLPTFAA